ncbi:MAG: PqqD family protein [Ruminococcus sp.]|nr:PqqD family protein [Ruminococcus sp.]
MKVKKDFVLKEIADSFLVVPLGSQVVNFGCIIKLSETGAFLWNQLEEDKTESELVSALLSLYDVDESKATADVSNFVRKLKEADLLE